MKLYILSDLHNEFSEFIPPKVNAEAVILAGDIHVKEKAIEWINKYFKNIPVIYILGNHEYYRANYPILLDKLKEKTKNTNIHILENESITIKGITFLGCTLWTDFNLFNNTNIACFAADNNMNDFRLVRKGFNYSKFKAMDSLLVHKKSIAWLNAEITKHSNIVIITHHCPSIKSVPDRYKKDILSAAYSSNLDSIVEKSNAKLWIHGHTHDSLDYIIGNTKVVCNPRGYYGHALNPNFKEDLVIEI